MLKVASKTRVVDASFGNGLGRAAEHAIVDMIRRSVKRVTDELLHRVYSRTLLYFAAASLLATGVVFALFGAAEGLRSARLPAAVAYGAIGVAALIGGFLFVHAMRVKRES